MKKDVCYQLLYHGVTGVSVVAPVDPLAPCSNRSFLSTNIFIFLFALSENELFIQHRLRYTVNVS